MTVTTQTTQIKEVTIMKGRLHFIIGFMLGAAVFGGSMAVAAGVIANPTTSKVFVNGAQASVEAYNINGSNYFKLRDIAQAADFSVTWDGAGNRILIDTTRGYTSDETTASPIPSQVQPPVQETAASIEEMKAEVIRLTNIERSMAGLPELAELPALMDTAQAKAEDMIRNHYYGHTSPVYGTPGEMMKAAIPSIKSCAENIAPWTMTPQEVVASLMDSNAHRSNVLSQKYTHIGIGIVEGADGGYWWVQHFAGL